MSNVLRGIIAENYRRDLARVTAERDEWQDKVIEWINRSAEERADLAAARAALEKIAREGIDTMDVATEALNRLGTGEAFQAVREAQEFLDEVEGAEAYVARLKAVFGE